MPDAAEAEHQGNNAERHHFIAVPASQLPPGRNVALFEDRQGRLTWVLREDARAETLLPELNRYAEHIIRHGLGATQRGDAPPPPPHQSPTTHDPRQSF